MFVFVGTFVHSTWESPLVVKEATAVGVDRDKIVFICSSNDLQKIKQEHGFSDAEVIILKKGQFILPGFIDTHIHASQYVNAGKGLDLTLLDWLDKYTFPAEARFHDVDYADSVFTKVVKRVLRSGTTTACYFTTIHAEASLKLCQVVARYGQRAFVGKVCSNQNSPSYYVETTEQSLADTERFIKGVQSMKNELITPIVTPRFAISCDFHLLQSLGEIKDKYNLPVQSHVSENKNECSWIKELFPDCDGYVDVYNKSNLLGPKTVMAHAIYISDEERDLLEKTQTGIAHCPNSNASLRSGICDVRRLLENNVKVGLGTDVSGGYSPSMLDAIRMSTHQSKLLSLDRPSSYRPVDYKEAFRLATLGGAQVLNIDSVTGNFEVGKQFDAIVVDVCCEQSVIDVFAEDTTEDLVQKFIHLGDDRNIRQVYVAGRKLTLD